MSTDTVLWEKRKELKHQLDEGVYTPQLWKWVDKTGQFIQKLCRNPEPPTYLFSAVVLAVIPLLISVLISLLLGESQTPRRELVTLELATIALLLVLFILHKLIFVVIFTTVREYLLDTVTSVTELVDIQQWLDFLDTNRVILFGLSLGILSTGLGIYLVVLPRIGFIPPGMIILGIIAYTAYGMGLFHLFQIWAWVIKLGRYQFKLYTTDPSNSEIIDRLSGMLRKILYLLAVFGVGLTLIFTIFGLTGPFWTILQIITVWGPIIGFFIAGQYSLSSIITNAKWLKLNHIQARIERLETEKNIEDKETIETIKRLIDYHNQIMGTPNSVLNVQASLTFLNSLLLPLLASLLANLDKVFEFF